MTSSYPLDPLREMMKTTFVRYGTGPAVWFAGNFDFVILLHWDGQGIGILKTDSQQTSLPVLGL